MLRKRNSRFIFNFIILLCLSIAASDLQGYLARHEIFLAQAKAVIESDTINNPKIEVDTLLIDAGDSSGVSDSIMADSVIIEPNLDSYGTDSILIKAYAVEPIDSIKRQPPSRALLKSVLFPGWGQYSNKKYLKAVLVFTVESYVVYKSIELGNKASDWHEKWRGVPDTLTVLKSEYFRKYADYRDRRNSFLWYTALTVFLSMFDAYVDAHLAPFPDSIKKVEDVSIEMQPAEEFHISLIYRF